MKRRLKYMILVIILLNLFQFSAVDIQTKTVQSNKRPLIIGTGTDIGYIDPHETYWRGDVELYMQICEGLYCTNLSDSENNFPIVPLLAADFGTWDVTKTEYTIPLREGVYFTDGTLFDASVVKWNFDRIYNLDASGYCQWGNLLRINNQTWTEGDDPDNEYLRLIKSVEILDSYLIKLVFHYPDMTVFSKLSFRGWSMLSPNSHSFDNPATDFLIGTGPFKLESIEPDGSRTMIRNEDYWREPADIPEIRWIYNPDSITVHTGMLGGPGIRQYDMIKPSIVEYYDQFRDDSTLVFVEDIPGQTFFYAGFNTLRIPIAHRKAMAYAFDYSFYIEDFWENTMDYMKTPIPPGVLGSKTDCNIPFLNITQARQFLIDSGDASTHGLTIFSTDQDWIDVAESGSPIASYNISHSTWTPWQAASDTMLENFKYIGIHIDDFPMDGMTLSQLINQPENFHKIDIYFMGWAPDYNDPHNTMYDGFANPINPNPMNFYNNSDFDSWTSLLINASLETDTEIRISQYRQLQRELLEEQYDLIPWIMLFTTKEYYLHTVELSDLSYNHEDLFYFYPCEWNPEELPEPVKSSEIAIIPTQEYLIYQEGSEGNQISWRLAAEEGITAHYEIYQGYYGTPIQQGTLQNGEYVGINVDSLDPGAYSYIIEVQGDSSSTFSQIIVFVKSDDPTSKPWGFEKGDKLNYNLGINFNLNFPEEIWSLMDNSITAMLNSSLGGILSESLNSKKILEDFKTFIPTEFSLQTEILDMFEFQYLDDGFYPEDNDSLTLFDIIITNNTAKLPSESKYGSYNSLIRDYIDNLIVFINESEEFPSELVEYLIEVVNYPLAILNTDTPNIKPYGSMTYTNDSFLPEYYIDLLSIPGITNTPYSLYSMMNPLMNQIEFFGYSAALTALSFPFFIPQDLNFATIYEAFEKLINVSLILNPDLTLNDYLSQYGITRLDVNTRRISASFDYTSINDTIFENFGICMQIESILDYLNASGISISHESMSILGDLILDYGNNGILNEFRVEILLEALTMGGDPIVIELEFYILNENPQFGGLSPLGIAGIVMGSVGGALGVSGLLVFLRKRRILGGQGSNMEPKIGINMNPDGGTTMQDPSDSIIPNSGGKTFSNCPRCGSPNPLSTRICMSCGRYM